MERTSISFAEDLADLPQPLERVRDLQHGLGDFDLEAEIGGDHVGQAARILQIFDDDHDVRNQHLAEADDPFDLLLHGSHDGFALEGGARGLGFGDFLDPDGIIGIGLDVSGDLGLGEALHQNLDPLVGQLQHPHDDADGADRVDVVRRGVLDVEGLLRREEDHPVARERRLDGLDRHLAADEQRQHHVRKHDDVAHRQQRQLVREFPRFEAA